VRWKDERGTPLAKLSKKSGNWWTGSRFLEMTAASSWGNRGILPSEWDELDPLDKAEIIAFIGTRAEMESHELWRLDQERKT
jgi:hypothetical protein